MSNHTPGPWVVADDNRNPGTIAIVHHTVHGYAAIYPSPRHKTSPYPAEQSANARLIAAAPEMYELIQALATSTESGYASPMSAAALLDTLHQLQGQAKQLLTQIKGGEE